MELKRKFGNVNLLRTIRHDGQIIFMNEERCDAVVVEEEIAFIVNTHIFTFLRAENLP